MLMVSSWLIVVSVNLSSNDKQTRLFVSIGYEVLGEFVFKISNMAQVYAMCQYVTCQLVNYRMLKLNSEKVEKLLEPLNQRQCEVHDKLLFANRRTMYIIMVGFVVFTTYNLYGLNLWILTYKVLLALFGTVAFASPWSELLIANSIYLHVTCSALIGRISELKQAITDVNNKKVVNHSDFHSIATKFQSICNEIVVYNVHWKKVIFFITSTSIPNTAITLLIAVETDSLVIKTMCILVALMAFSSASLVIILPARVESKLRQCHSLLCQMICRRSHWTLKLKLSRLIKQYNNQITFTIWDTNKINYMDYNEVSSFKVSTLI